VPGRALIKNDSSFQDPKRRGPLALALERRPLVFRQERLHLGPRLRRARPACVGHLSHALAGFGPVERTCSELRPELGHLGRHRRALPDAFTPEGVEAGNLVVGELQPVAHAEDSFDTGRARTGCHPLHPVHSGFGPGPGGSLLGPKFRAGAREDHREDHRQTHRRLIHEVTPAHVSVLHGFRHADPPARRVERSFVRSDHWSPEGRSSLGWRASVIRRTKTPARPDHESSQARPRTGPVARSIAEQRARLRRAGKAALHGGGLDRLRTSGQRAALDRRRAPGRVPELRPDLSHTPDRREQRAAGASAGARPLAPDHRHRLLHGA
jgi:hypothetical protein